MKKTLIAMIMICAMIGVLAFSVSATGAAPEAGAPETNFWDFFNDGKTLALIGAFLAVGLCGIGSAKGVGIAGQTAAGVVSENPKMAGKLIVLEALPATQGIYGFVVAFLVVNSLGLFSGGIMSAPALSVADGMYYLFACMPIAIVGLISAIHQAKVASAGMQMVAKQQRTFGMAITYSALVETYAILALLISALLVINH